MSSPPTESIHSARRDAEGNCDDAAPPPEWRANRLVQAAGAHGGSEAHDPGRQMALTNGAKRTRQIREKDCSVDEKDRDRQTGLPKIMSRRWAESAL